MNGRGHGLERAVAGLGRRSGSIAALGAAGAVFVVGAAALAFHVAHYWPFLVDDALISLRYSERLASGHGLTWTAGEPVEGYSNLLWVLLCIPLHWLGIDWVMTLRVLGTASALAAMLALIVGHRPRGLRLRALAPAAIGVLIIACSGPVAIWSIGGLEANLLGGLLAMALVAANGFLSTMAAPRSDLVCGVCFGLVAWTRADGFVLVGAAVLGLLLARRARELSRLARIVAIPLAMVALQFAFRRLYYHDWVPNTAHVKVQFTSYRLETGYQHVKDGLYIHAPALLVASTAIWAAFEDRMARRRAIALGTTLIAWLAYQVLIGGDIFAGYRHMVPAVVLVALLAANGLEVAMRERVSVAWYAVLASLASLPFMLHFQLDDPVNKKGTFELWELEGEPIGRLLDRHFGARQPLYAIDAAGCLGFWSKLPALDMLGLNDRYIALHPPAKIGVDLVGHEFGDGLYVLSREPDLVQFGVPQDYGGPKYASERVMMADPRFRRAYVQVTFLTFGADQRPVVSKIWVNKTSPRSGVVDRDGGLSIPGYLFASENDLRARESSDGRLGTRIPSGRRAGFGLELPNPGRWNVRVTSEGSVPRIALGSGHASSLGIGTAAITAPLNALRIEIEPTGADVDVFEVMATHGIEPLGLGRQTDTRIH